MRALDRQKDSKRTLQLKTLRLPSLGELDITGSHQEQYADQLKKSRQTVAKELQAALKCRTADEKQALVKRWKKDYSPLMANQLLTLARSKHAKEIAGWGNK